MRVSDVIAAAGGVRPQAYLIRANLIRRDADDKTTLLRIDLQAALNGDPDADFVLGDRDEITVFTYDEVQWQDRSVRIEGAVQRPGPYVRSENMRVSDLVFVSGGLLPEAARELEVARHAGNGENEVIAIDAASLVPYSEEDVLLEDGDVVTVPAVRLPVVASLAHGAAVSNLGEVNWQSLQTLMVLIGLFQLISAPCTNTTSNQGLTSSVLQWVVAFPLSPRSWNWPMYLCVKKHMR